MSAEQGKARILVVDDDEALLGMLADLLSSAGYCILEAGDGNRALACVMSELPDLVLLDWNLPKMSGLEVCKAMRRHEDERVRSIPVVMLTAMNSPEDARTAFAAGVNDFLTKPFTPAHLSAQVASWTAAGGPDAAV